jgi:predicted Zn-dependent protease
MTFGADPRQGFFRGSLFLQPDLQFQINFPPAWKTQNRHNAVLAQSGSQDALMQLTVAAERTPEAALQTFLTQEGIVAGLASSGSINGFPAATARFQATTQQVAMEGLVTCVSYRGAVYRLLAYAPQTVWANYEATARASFQSFNRLTDPAALAVQPLKLTIVRVDRPMTLGEFQARYPSQVDLATVARLNQLDVGAGLTAGQLVKRIVGGPLP